MPSLPTWNSLTSSPQSLRRLLRFWPPYAAAGISMVEIADDWSRVVMQLRLRPWTANFVGTQYGGSMFSMTDPWWMIPLLRRLGPDYVVWDKAARIDFLRPGTGNVRATFEITDDLVADLREAAAGGAKVLRWLPVDIVAADGTVVARVDKQVYVRLKPGREPNSVG